MGKNTCNYFIVIRISNHDKSYDKNHRVSFFMSQSWLVYFIDHFGARNTEILYETINLIVPLILVYKLTVHPRR